MTAPIRGSFLAGYVVDVRFKNPQKVRAIVETESTQLWVSVEDRDGFMKALAEACHLGVEAHTPF